MTAYSHTIRQSYIWLPCALAGFLVFLLLNRSALVAMCGLVFIGCAFAMLRWPRAGTLLALFVLYSNVAVLAMRPSNAVEASAGSADLNPRIAIVLVALCVLLLVPFLHQVFIRKEKIIFDRGLTLMLLYFFALLASTVGARDLQLAEFTILDYVVEGLILYFVLINIIRDWPTLRQSIWVLLLAGALMGTFSVFQAVTHTQSNDYGGFAQIETDLSPGRAARGFQSLARYSPQQIVEGGETVDEPRAAGPIGETNRYGQILIVLLPLGVLMVRIEHTRALRIGAMVSIGLILAGLILTLSREAVLTAIIVFAMMPFLGLLKPRQVIIGIVAVTLAAAICRPGIVTRMASLDRLTDLFSKTYASGQGLDSSAIRRYVENVAAWNVFLDHPVLGVGPGHFMPYYSSDYANRVGLLEEIQGKGYRGHNLYLETLAETGIVGLVCFLAVVFVFMHGLWKQIWEFKRRHSDFAFVATALFLSLTAYVLSAVFAHLTYQRYFWLLIALASATIRILQSQFKAIATAEAQPSSEV
jgi:putative inorganic carbon (hco3(-)) transporter